MASQVWNGHLPKALRKHYKYNNTISWARTLTLTLIWRCSVCIVITALLDRHELLYKVKIVPPSLHVSPAGLIYYGCSSHKFSILEALWLVVKHYNLWSLQLPRFLHYAESLILLLSISLRWQRFVFPRSFLSHGSLITVVLGYEGLGCFLILVCFLHSPLIHCLSLFLLSMVLYLPIFVTRCVWWWYCINSDHWCVGSNVLSVMVSVWTGFLNMLVKFIWRSFVQFSWQ